MNYQVLDLNLNYKALGLDNGGYCPRLTTYILDNSPEIDMERTRPVIVICPGGGYGMTSDRESEAVAMQYLSFGYHVLLLRYSIAPAVFPAALVEVATVVKMAREHAKEWHIDVDKVFVQGFSAGGHLACSIGVLWQEEFLQKLMNCDPKLYRPDGVLLSYPVITSGEFAHRGSFVNLLGDQYDELVDTMSLETRVSEQTPPMFIWHTYSDDAVPLENSLLLASALRRHDVPFELHIFPQGGHGLGLANEETMSLTGFGIQEECQPWIHLANTWIQHQ